MEGETRELSSLERRLQIVRRIEGGEAVEGKPKRAAFSCVEALREKLQGLGSAIHAHPELNFEEHFAHDAIASFLESELNR